MKLLLERYLDTPRNLRDHLGFVTDIQRYLLQSDGSKKKDSDEDSDSDGQDHQNIDPSLPTSSSSNTMMHSGLSPILYRSSDEDD